MLEGASPRSYAIRWREQRAQSTVRGKVVQRREQDKKGKLCIGSRVVWNMKASNSAAAHNVVDEGFSRNRKRPGKFHLLTMVSVMAHSHCPGVYETTCR